MRQVRRVWLIAVLLAWSGIGCWAAEPRLLVLRDDSPLTRTAAELLVQELTRAGYSPTSVNIGEGGVTSGVDAGGGVIALGIRAHAIALKVAAGRPVVTILVTRAGIDDQSGAVGDRGSVIVLDQPVHRWSNLLQLAFPGKTQVGTLVGPGGNRMLGSIERSLGDRRISLSTEAVAAAEDVVPALERLIPRMGILLALPDPVAHNRNTVQALLLTTYRAGIPVVAFSEAYLQAGAVLVLYSTLPQIVAQVLDTLRQIREGKPVPGIQTPRYFTVGINSVVARSLGLRLPAASELEDRLRALDQ
jgi:ABC-type uncharacterized transport system substrate-binding protein